MRLVQLDRASNFGYQRIMEFDPQTREALARWMNIWKVEEYLNSVELRGRIRPPLKESIEALKRELDSQGYFGIFQRSGDEHIVRYGLKPPHLRPARPWINLILFLTTIATTLLVGSFNRGGNPIRNPADLVLGIPFSFSILLILGTHELGHYFVSRRAGIDATLPYFLPLPHPLIGTLGAVIRIRSLIPNRRALVHLGVAGPLAGFLFAVPITAIGLKLSKVQPLSELEGGIGLGSSLLFTWLSKLFFPQLPPGCDVILHPMAFAGWLGFLVTAMNLMPLGQLDGGHIVYGVLGRYRKPIIIGFLLGLLLLGIFWSGWWFWGMLAALLGLHHPPPQDDITPLSSKEFLLAGIALLIFILSFIPVPFPVIPGVSR